MYDNDDRRKRKTDRSAVFNLGCSGGANVALEKDAMLGDAIEARLKKRQRKRQSQAYPQPEA